MIPIPIWAADIIQTSLAPSPIDNVEESDLYSLIRHTTYYFYKGLTRQHSTDDTFSAASTKAFCKNLFSS